MNTAVESLDISQHDLTYRQREIIAALIANDGISINEISAALKDSPALRTLRTEMNKLKNAGIIRLEGRAKTAKWYLCRKKN